MKHNIIITLGLLVIILGIGYYNGFNQEVQQGLQEDSRGIPSRNLNYTHPSNWTEADSIRIIDSLRCNDTIFDQLIRTSENLDTINVMIDRILLKLDTLKQIRALRDSLETIDPDMMYMDTIMNDVDMDCVGDNFNEDSYIHMMGVEPVEKVSESEYISNTNN